VHPNAALLVVLLAALALPACRNRETAGGEATETIEPAAPQPAPTGTDAMTQTVNVEQGRSEAEGGGLTSPTTADTALDTTVTSTVAAPTTAPTPSTTTR
jgi:hypothetical protein